MKRTPSVGQLARQATSRAAHRSWQKLRKVHPYRMQQVITAIFITVVLIVSLKASITFVQRWRKCRPGPTDDALGYTDPIFPAATAYKRSIQLKRTPDACAEAADFPQVALLLLSKGEIPHEVMWREWFTQAVGKLPLEPAKASLCAGAKAGNNKNSTITNRTFSPEEIYTACSRVNSPKTENNNLKIDDETDLISHQHLFDVWIHPAVDFPGFPSDSVFYGREIPREFRVHTVWGTHTIIDATRALLAAALTNPRAEKFVLMSESDVPLYSPMALYTQTMAESKSRVNACNNTGGGGGDVDSSATSSSFLSEEELLTKQQEEENAAGVAAKKNLRPLKPPSTIGTTSTNGTAIPLRGRPDWNHNDGYRLRDDMIAEGLTLSTWRKSWQWIALTRRHAELAVDDVEVDATFRATCRRRWDPDWCDHRVCYSDEHYFPTLLSVHGVENETDCYGELTDRDWSRVASTDPHPWEYRPREVGAKLIKRLRHSERPGCSHSGSISTAAKTQFLDIKTLLTKPGIAGTETGTAGAKIDTTMVCAAASQVHLYRPLGPQCPLLARKFLNNTVNAVLATLLPCAGGLGIVNDAENCETNFAKKQQSLLTRLDLNFPPDEESGSNSRWNSLAFILFFFSCIAAILVWTLRKRRQQSKRLPLSHSESFHTALKHYGVIE
jgi:Core-2/I-Branching enzyme